MKEKFIAIEGKDREPFARKVNALLDEGYKVMASGQSGTDPDEQLYWAHLNK